MRNVKYIVKKEFLQVIRNKQILPIIFIVPMIQLLVLVHAATFELQKIDTCIVDADKSEYSMQLTEKYTATNRFHVVDILASETEAIKYIENGKAKIIINIPRNFEKNIESSASAKVQFIINSIDGAAAGIIQSYASSVLMDFSSDLAAENPMPINIQSASILKPVNINIIGRYWYNPELNYKTYMVPGILVVLVTVIGMMLTSMNIVKEKELGTIEQLNVSPIKKHELIIGKLFPFWVIANIDLAVGLTMAKLMFDTPMLGNIFLLFGLASVYLLVVLSVGLLISTSSATQQESNLLSFFFMMIFILMSGLFTPIDSMPFFAKVISFINPMSHFIEILRRVMLKGAGIAQVQNQVLILFIIGVSMVMLAAWRFKKTSG